MDAENTRPARHVLVIDSDPAVARGVAARLGTGFDVETCQPELAVERLASFTFDVLLVAQKPSAGDDDDDGISMLRRLRRAAPELGILVFAESPTVTATVMAMRVGAYDVLSKDVDGRTLRAAVERAADHASLTREVQRLRGEVERACGLGEVVGRSQAMRDLMSMVERVAAADATVLIFGESGTGKELLARTLHRVGPRRAMPFVAFDCSALTPSLLAAELFGHEKGAFTGAGHARRGLFREAHGGTIFLDEIGDIAPSVQNKLLRVLQEREIKPVGSDKFVGIDVRVVAATNKDLRQLIARGEFREDLYWRLAVVPLQVPPLRERMDDLPALAAHILARRGGARAPTLTPGALQRLLHYHWPGNIRELENVLSRAAILCRNQQIRSDDLELVGLTSGTADQPITVVPGVSVGVRAGRPLRDMVSEAVSAVERAALTTALSEAAGSAARAARSLGISRASMYSKLREHGLRSGGGREPSLDSRDERR